jgi:hypothetical protein
MKFWINLNNKGRWWEKEIVTKRKSRIDRYCDECLGLINKNDEYWINGANPSTLNRLLKSGVN